MNIDLSVEYYMPAGLLTVAPFYKRIDNPIYGWNEIQQDVDYNGRHYEFFGLSQPRNADYGRITGVELNFQDMFTFLPSPLDGLGVNLNYTFTDSSVTIFGREADDLPFFRQSDHIGNASVLYDKSGFTAQLSVSFNSPFLDDIGSNPDTDNYFDYYTPMDFKFGFPLMRALRGFVELRNLNDAPRRRYAGISDRRVHHEIYSRDVYLGIDWRF